MRIWRYIDPGPDLEPIETIMSDAQILETYYPRWSETLFRQGKGHLISPENCIEDWVTENWASELK